VFVLRSVRLTGLIGAAIVVSSLGLAGYGLISQGDDEAPAFAIDPALPRPTLDPAAAEPRDLQRQQDLETVAFALEQYFSEEGEFPTTNGNLQTLCAYDVDAGCVLFASPREALIDPLGETLLNGYWYVSDGQQATVLAITEGEPQADLAACAFYAPDRMDPRVGLCISVPR
jgi:hypothetical protein